MRCSPGSRRSLPIGTARGTAQRETVRQPSHCRASSHMSSRRIPARPRSRARDAAERVDYAAMTAERSAIATGVVELVTVAQALHWFDRDRLLRRGASSARAARRARRLELRPVHPRRSGTRSSDAPLPRRDRRPVLAGGAGAGRSRDTTELTFPFDELSAPPLRDGGGMDARSVRRATCRPGPPCSVHAPRRARTPCRPSSTSLRAGWATDDAARRVEWPLSMRVGRV